jgi:hypothetical protein
MRWGTLLITCFVLVGCASKQAQPQAATQPLPQERVYEDAVAAALVYDPPAVVDQPRVEISRENRRQSAYAGIEEVTVTSYYLWQDDRQLMYGGNGSNRHQDRFERQAITTKTGVSYR